MEHRTYGSPAVVALVRRLFEEEKDESILPDDDPRKAEVEAMDLPNVSYNVLCECLATNPKETVKRVVNILSVIGGL